MNELRNFLKFQIAFSPLISTLVTAVTFYIFSVIPVPFRSHPTSAPAALGAPTAAPTADMIDDDDEFLQATRRIAEERQELQAKRRREDEALKEKQEAAK